MSREEILKFIFGLWYTPRRSLEQELEFRFPGGEWSAPQEREESPGLAAQSPPESPALTVIGGTKFDEARLDEFLSNLPPETVIVTGEGRGTEKRAAKIAEEWGFELELIRPDEDLYGTKAAKVAVECVMSHRINSPVLLVGGGQRVKEARSWLARASWEREVIEL